LFLSNKKMKFKIIYIVTFCFFFSTSKAQDPIFTQYFVVPQTLNPGFTGFMETFNAGIIHRTQWPDLNLKIDTDYTFFNSWVEQMNSGIGVSLLSHRENFTNYNYTQANINYAFKVELNDEWYFRPAIEFGFGNKSFGFKNLLLNDQINIDTGVINNSSIDPLLLNSKISFFDFNAGMLFNNENVWFGLSVKHLNRPNISFTNDGNIPLAPFTSIIGGYEMKLSEYRISSFLPNSTKILFTANYMNQGQYNRLDFGSGLFLDTVFFGAIGVVNPISNAQNSQFLTSVNLFTGLRYEHLKFSFSYDLNTSKIGRTGGIYELSMTYQFNLDAKCLGCPSYY